MYLYDIAELVTKLRQLVAEKDAYLQEIMRTLRRTQKDLAAEMAVNVPQPLTDEGVRACLCLCLSICV